MSVACPAKTYLTGGSCATAAVSAGNPNSPDNSITGIAPLSASDVNPSDNTVTCKSMYGTGANVPALAPYFVTATAYCCTPK